MSENPQTPIPDPGPPAAVGTLLKAVGAAIAPVQDPEIRIGIADLGLIYGAEIGSDPKGGGARVRVRMSLTSPACPYGPMLLASVHAAVAKVPGVTDVDVDLAFEPLWDPRTMASDEAKDQLGIF